MTLEKSKTAATLLAVAIVAAMASTEPVWAGTDLSNVAWKQPVTANAFGGPWYGQTFAENSSGSVGVGPGEEARELINDDITGSTGWAYPNADGGGAWIDLGSFYNIAYIEVMPQSNSNWHKLEYATVYGSSEKTTAAEYSFIIPNKGSGDDRHVQSTPNWYGVRWIRIVDETESISDPHLTIGEIRVYAPVTTYGNFLGGTSASATSTYNDTDLYSSDFLVNHQGMSDQHGPVGYTAAVSNPNIGLWMNTSNGTGGFVDQALTFDLGGPRSLDRLRIWNFNQSIWSTSSQSYVDQTDRGICEALIEYSQDGGETYIAFDDTNGTALGNYTIPKATTYSSGAPKTNTYQLSTGLGDVIADHVRITIKGNYGNSYYAGLSEVRFYGSVPEVPGDTNNDAIVDETDMQTLANWWGTNVTPGDASKGDFNNDGTVNSLDASILAAQWGITTSEIASSEYAAGGNAVPEPSSLALLATLALGGTLLRRRS